MRAASADPCYARAVSPLSDNVCLRGQYIRRQEQARACRSRSFRSKKDRDFCCGLADAPSYRRPGLCVVKAQSVVGVLEQALQGGRGTRRGAAGDFSPVTEAWLS